ncbi:DUF3150 domain-containing protein [Shewanella morhuae]|uniref:Protein of uncharacterized function (DUF3150) n=1 Tax=Shewanella morhuae TaxID=365591 RepID=A0A380BVN1_9GAMM|nr:DUF3150 domain-containing protein [Shewanella morhuae]SUJ07822.1 Protein of uncharacterised function (DUF3150) [Shewanella morhuae]
MDTSTSTNQALTTTTEICSRLTQLEKGVCVVNIITLGACGEKALPKVKVELDGKLEDSDSIKGAKIRWFPKEPLNFVSKAKQAISRTLNVYGVRWGDMTIVPLARLDELQCEIAAIQADWELSLTDMLDNYDSLVSNWQMSNLDVADIMRRSTMDKSEFGGRFKMKMLPPVAFNPLIAEGDIESAEELAEDILGNLYAEVAKMAGDIYDKSFFVADANGHKVARTKANRRIKDSFRSLIAKLNGLSFLDHNIEKVIAQTNLVLDSMPKTGWIEGANLSNLARWTLVMASPEMLKNHVSDDFVLETEPAVIEDDFGVLGESVSTNLDEDLGSFEVVVEPEFKTEIVVDTPLQPQELEPFEFGLGF